MICEKHEWRQEYESDYLYYCIHCLAQAEETIYGIEITKRTLIKVN